MDPLRRLNDTSGAQYAVINPTTFSTVHSTTSSTVHGTCSAVLKLVQECVVSFVYRVVIVNMREPNERASTQITSQIYETDEEAILTKMKLYDF